MLRRISLIFFLLFSLPAQADLNYQNYLAGGAQPAYTQDVNGNITNRTLLSTGTVNTVGLTTSSGAGLPTRSDGFIVRFYGFINITTAGTYYFGGQADDGIRIKVNNVSVVNSWIESGGDFRSGSINLSAGVVPIEVMFYENGGGQMVNLQWFINGSWQIVPSTSTATSSTYFAPAYSSGISLSQATRKASETTQRLNQSGNNQVIVQQIGDNNNFTIRQGATVGGKNRIELYSNGSYNTLNLNQGYNTNGTVSAGDSNDHYLSLTLNGNTNTVNTSQTGIGKWNEINLTGNNNSITNLQSGTGSKILFESVSGNNNTITTNQKDAGNQYLDIKLTGAGHSVTAVQEGAGNHAATIDFTNSGGASSLNLNQSGSTAQTYSIQQSCVNAAGCSTSITQP
jgi:hypothetical protein